MIPELEEPFVGRVPKLPPAELHLLVQAKLLRLTNELELQRARDSQGREARLTALKAQLAAVAAEMAELERGDASAKRRAVEVAATAPKTAGKAKQPKRARRAALQTV